MPNHQGTRDINRLVRDLHRAGIRVEKTAKEHWKVYCPNGKLVFMGCSPRVSSLAATRADLRRNGVQL